MAARPRKLSLSKETLRHLNLEQLADRDLDGVVGGTATPTLEGDCWVINTVESICYPCASYTCQ